jgi:hypothetical protein
MPAENNLKGMEPHQYEDIYHEDDVPLRDITKGVSYSMVYFGCGLFSVLLILSVLIRIPREINLPFVLRGGASEQIIQFPEKIYIKEKYVRAGDSIAEGDSLMAITSPKIIEIIEEIDAWESRLVLYEVYKKRSDEQAIAILQTQREGLVNERNSILKELSTVKNNRKQELVQLKRQLSLQEKNHERNKTLFDNKVIADVDLERSEQLVSEANSNLIGTRERYELDIAAMENRAQSLHNALALLEKEYEKKETDIELEKEEINKNMRLARERLKLNFGPVKITGNAITLLCPSRGRVTLVTEAESEVPSEHIIVRIQTDSSSFFAYSEARPEQIGMIRKNLYAVMKYQSFPHYYYGTMKASIINVSPSPNAEGKYTVIMNIVNPGKLHRKVTKGMTGTASIIVEEKSVADFVFKAFLKQVTID